MTRNKLLGAVIIGSLVLGIIVVGFSGVLFAKGSWRGGARFGPAWGFGPLHPGIETSTTVYTVCKFFDAENNCNKCSNYFTVRSEDEAQAKCARGGYDDAYYFPSVSRVFSWMGGHCTCGNNDEVSQCFPTLDDPRSLG